MKGISNQYPLSANHQKFPQFYRKTIEFATKTDFFESGLA